MFRRKFNLQIDLLRFWILQHSSCYCCPTALVPCQVSFLSSTLSTAQSVFLAVRSPGALLDSLFHIRSGYLQGLAYLLNISRMAWHMIGVPKNHTPDKSAFKLRSQQIYGFARRWWTLILFISKSTLESAYLSQPYSVSPQTRKNKRKFFNKNSSWDKYFRLISQQKAPQMPRNVNEMAVNYTLIEIWQSCGEVVLIKSRRCFWGWTAVESLYIPLSHILIKHAYPTRLMENFRQHFHTATRQVFGDLIPFNNLKSLALNCFAFYEHDKSRCYRCTKIFSSPQVIS